MSHHAKVKDFIMNFIYIYIYIMSASCFENRVETREIKKTKTPATLIL
jgi:hypothetical protein